MKTVMVCLDGIGSKHLRYTTFIQKLIKKSLFGKLEPTFGFSAIYSILTGKYPDEHGLLTEINYNKDGINFFEAFKFIERIADKNLRVFLTILYNLKEYILGRNGLKSIYKIPLGRIKYFDFIRKKSIFDEKCLATPTIFEILRKSGKRCCGYIWPHYFENERVKLDFRNITTTIHGVDDRIFKKSLALLKHDFDFCYIHFIEGDHEIHIYGTESSRIKRRIEIYDKYIEKIHDFADNLILFSDHSMINIKKTINIESTIKNLDLDFGKDYIMFLDSTLVRFWFLNTEAKTKVKHALAKLNCGHILMKKEFKKFRIPKNFGELIFLIDPGVLIYPNYFQTELVKAMHGYNPTTPNQKGFYLINSPNLEQRKKDIKAVDLMPLVLRLVR